MDAPAPIETRLIRKYPNRRLYDTHASRYITLDEIFQLVLNHTPFQIQDSRTKKNITRAILLQIIAVREENDNSIFPKDLLTLIIRLYGHPMQRDISRCLEFSTNLFLEHQYDFEHQHNSIETISKLFRQLPDPVLSLLEIAAQQAPIWRAIQQELLKNQSPSE